MSFCIPHTISATDALRLIAQSNRAGGCHRLSKEEMITLARVACKTEGIAWEGAYARPKEPAQ
jgi:hypothetical protein